MGIYRSGSFLCCLQELFVKNKALTIFFSKKKKKIWQDFKKLQQIISFINWGFTSKVLLFEFLFIFVVLEIEPRVSSKLGKLPSTELYLQTFLDVFSISQFLYLVVAYIFTMYNSVPHTYYKSLIQ